ncbi:MAG: hypothetical protein ACODAJ_11515 [Planctomycetota bacterium]
MSYAYHYDRNAIAARRQVGQAVVALTRAGNLVRYELPALRMTGEAFGERPVTCLGADPDGAPLAGFEDGSICQIDPTTLSRKEVARLPGKPEWVGAYRRGQRIGFIGVVGYPNARRPDRFDWGKRLSEPACTVHDTATGRKYPLPLGVDTALVDSKLRLWVGLGMGEFGGWCACIDLTTGQTRVVMRYCCPVLGFLELPDGAVWMYGGCAGHLQYYSGAVVRVDLEEPSELYRSLVHNDELAHEPADRPIGTMLQMVLDSEGEAVIAQTSGRWRVVDEPDGEGYVVRNPDRWFRASLDLEQWERMRAAPERLRGLLGALPPMSGQLRARETDRVLPSALGTLFIPNDSDDSPWSLVNGQWETRSFDLPAQPDGLCAGWGFQVLTDSDGTVQTVHVGHAKHRSSSQPRVVWIARWRHGKPEVTSTRAPKFFAPQDVFKTPDGEFWALDYPHLWHLKGAEWVHVAAAPNVWRAPVVVNADGPPWLLLPVRDRDCRKLLVLEYGNGVAEPSLRVATFAGARFRPRDVYDALPWSRGKALLATSLGLRLYDAATEKLLPAPFQQPRDRIEVLCRDGEGRLWLGGRDLWLLPSREPAPARLAGVPLVGWDSLVSLSADPDHKTGVIAVLGRRGVLFLRARDRSE